MLGVPLTRVKVKFTLGPVVGVAVGREVFVGTAVAVGRRVFVGIAVEAVATGVAVCEVPVGVPVAVLVGVLVGMGMPPEPP